MQFTFQIERDPHSLLEVCYDSPRQHITIYKDDKAIFSHFDTTSPYSESILTHCVSLRWFKDISVSVSRRRRSRTQLLIFKINKYVCLKYSTTKTDIVKVKVGHIPSFVLSGSYHHVTGSVDKE